MTKYSWKNGNDVNISFYLTIFSVMTYPFIEIGIHTLCESLIKMYPNFNMSISKIMNSLLSVISVSSLFRVLCWLFDKYIWKFKYVANTFGTYDFSGKWCGTLQSSYTREREIPIILEIEQTYRNISCRCEFPDTDSTSVADMVQIDTTDRLSPLLKFTYRNQSRSMNTVSQIHVGYNELRFIDGKLKGFYFTNRENPTRGNMILEKMS